MENRPPPAIYLPGMGAYVSTPKMAAFSRPISTAAVMILLEYQR